MTNVDQQEINKFSELASRWWDPEGEFKPLHLINPLRLDFINQHSEGLFDKQVVDIGCGGGATTKRIAAAIGPKGRVLGVDISEPLLDLARSRCRELTQVSFENADAQVHPLPQQSFDLITSRFGVMFFSDPYAAFANLGKALTLGGRLQFVCFAPIERNPWFTVPLGVVARHVGKPDPSPPRAPGPHAFSCLLYTSPSPRDLSTSRMPSSA